MRHITTHAFDAFRQAVGLPALARADVFAARTLKLKTTKATKTKV